MDRYTIGGFKHSATVIKGLQSSAISTGLELMVESGSGAVDAAFLGVSRLQPEVTFSALSLKTLLAITGNIGAALASDKLYLQKMAEASTRAGASSHICVTMATGMMIPQRITASAHRAATIGVRVIPTSSNGVLSPLAIVANASLETAQDDVSEVYTLSTVSINGTALDGVDNVEINFNIEPDIFYGSGHIYPTGVAIMSRRPTITISTFDVSKFVTWSAAGLPQDTNDSTILFADQLECGVRGTTPITCSIDEGHIGLRDITNNQGQRSGGSVVITPTYDQVADILAWTGIT